MEEIPGGLLPIHFIVGSGRPHPQPMNGAHSASPFPDAQPQSAVQPVQLLLRQATPTQLRANPSEQFLTGVLSAATPPLYSQLQAHGLEEEAM